MKDKNGNKLSNDEDKNQRWREHFDKMLNREAPIETVEIEQTPEVTILDINTGPITCTEIRTALMKTKNGKAGGIDNLTAELLKVDKETTVKKLKEIFDEIWDQETIPNRWRKGIRIPKKGNWRGITLLPIASKIF